jgi:hypothetical protein
LFDVLVENGAPPLPDTDGNQYTAWLIVHTEPNASKSSDVMNGEGLECSSVDDAMHELLAVLYKNRGPSKE